MAHMINDTAFALLLTRPKHALMLLCVAALSGCAVQNVGAEGNDPFEGANRSVHAFNKGFDTSLLRPVATTLVEDGQGPLTRGIANFADNLELPGRVVNNVLQFRLGKAAENTTRFGINTALGLGGMFDLATLAGVNGKKTDFGETLHVWGMGEGPYIELPALGPSNMRDALGTVVDFVIDPLKHVVPSPERYVGTAAKVLSKIGDRGRYSTTVDSILYESADSYAQAKTLYLQNRRFELGQTVADTDFVDPYEDPYGQ
jgi:phospholipid-binding lipoprotein MlaA